MSLQDQGATDTLLAVGNSAEVKGRALIPRGGNDKVYTPRDVASTIVGHFRPQGRILEPCRGDGAFSDIMPGCDWCEIDQGRDFFDQTGEYDWIVTNPPWSQFRQFLIHSMKISDNIVFLALAIAWFSNARQREMKNKGFGIKEMLMLPKPPPPWPQFGMSLAAVHIQKGWTGPITLDNSLI